MKTTMTPKGLIQEPLTQDEIDEREQANIKSKQDEVDAKDKEQAHKDLKASAKAKLIAGEALTEDEANTIVL